MIIMQFSVIIPLYNKAPYVGKALRSVLDQTFTDFEVIVVDDGSTDESAHAAEIALSDASVEWQLIRQENAGVSMARNNGAAHAKGAYLCFLDADDWWDPSFLERMDWLIREYPDAGIWGTNYYYVKNGRKRVCVPGAETGYINYCKVYAAGMAMPLTSISVAVRPAVYDEFHGFNPALKLGEDFDLWIRIALNYKVAFLNEPLAFYNQDVNPSLRAVGHLKDPKVHMLWNLGYLESEEKVNPDYKQLIDNLRTYGLFPYYLSKQYREAAREELQKVDWSRQSKMTARLYKKPIALLRFEMFVRRMGAIVKHWILGWL